MDDNLAKRIQTRFEELPEDVQKAIQSGDVDKKIQDIGNKHHLHLDQVDILDNEARLVMLGFSDPEEFPKNLAEQLKINSSDAEVVAQEISAEIFVPIRESMQEFMEERVLQEQLREEKKISTPSVPTSSPQVPSSTPKSSATITPADMMLSQSTVSISKPPTTPPTSAANPTLSIPTPSPSPKVEAPKPGAYKADPYREPPE